MSYFRIYYPWWWNFPTTAPCPRSLGPRFRSVVSVLARRASSALSALQVRRQKRRAFLQRLRAE